jgi:hypothetical protein
MTKSVQQEGVFIYRMFPFLAHLESQPLSPQEYQTLINEMARVTQDWISPSPSVQALAAEFEAGIKSDYPEAKRYLLAHGKSPKEVEAMPVSQVVLIYHLRTFEQTRDNIYKWINVPYRQGWEGMQQAEKQIAGLKKQMKNNFLVRILGLSYKPYLTAAKLDRQISVLRCIEAIRMYAANHNNKLPIVLTDITEVPLPNDPITGRPFIYTAHENQAVIELPAPAGEKADTGKRYEITLKSHH